jgi:hypothetical protein
MKSNPKKRVRVKVVENDESVPASSWIEQFPFLKQSSAVVVALKSCEGYRNPQLWGLEGTYLVGKVQATEGGRESWSSGRRNFDPGHLPPSLGLLQKFKNNIQVGTCLYAEERKRRWGMVTTTEGVNKRVLRLNQAGHTEATEVLENEIGVDMDEGLKPMVWECKIGSPHAAACLLPPVASLTVEDIAGVSNSSGSGADMTRFLSALQGGVFSNMRELYGRFAPLFSAHADQDHWPDVASSKGFEVVVTRGGGVIRLPQAAVPRAVANAAKKEGGVGGGGEAATTSAAGAATSVQSSGMDSPSQYFSQAYPLMVTALLGDHQPQHHQYQEEKEKEEAEEEKLDQTTRQSTISSKHAASSLTSPNSDTAGTVSVPYCPALYPALFVPLHHRPSFLSNLSKKVAGRTIVLSGKMFGL